MLMACKHASALRPPKHDSHRQHDTQHQNNVLLPRRPHARVKATALITPSVPTPVGARATRLRFCGRSRTAAESPATMQPVSHSPSLPLSPVARETRLDPFGGRSGGRKGGGGLRHIIEETRPQRKSSRAAERASERLGTPRSSNSRSAGRPGGGREGRREGGRRRKQTGQSPRPRPRPRLASLDLRHRRPRPLSRGRAWAPRLSCPCLSAVRPLPPSFLVASCLSRPETHWGLSRLAPPSHTHMLIPSPPLPRPCLRRPPQLSSPRIPRHLTNHHCTAPPVRSRRGRKPQHPPRFQTASSACLPLMHFNGRCSPLRLPQDIMSKGEITTICPPQPQGHRRAKYHRLTGFPRNFAVAISRMAIHSQFTLFNKPPASLSSGSSPLSSLSSPSSVLVLIQPRAGLARLPIPNLSISLPLIQNSKACIIKGIV